MSEPQPMFSASIPADYDQYLGPFLFDFYARDLADRLAVLAGGSILETTCGTGILTEHLRRVVVDDVSIVATDVSEPMLEVARSRRGRLEGVRYQQADAMDLPFEEASFAAAAQQFGLMFLPDKLKAMSEMRRVLRPGGRLVFNVWGDMASNPFVQVVQDAIAPFFDREPPEFLYVPWSYSEQDPIASLLEQAGFGSVQFHVVDHVAVNSTAHDVATGFVRGNPTIAQVRERANASPDEVIHAVAEALQKSFGRDQLRLPMRALVVTAERPLG